MMLEAERNLVRRAKKGDGDAFATLTRPYHQRLFETASFLTNDADEAADLAQECLIRAYLSIRKFREDASPLPWLLKILKNLFIDSRRSARNKYEILSSDLDPEMGSEGMSRDVTAACCEPSDALEELLRKERQEELSRLIAALPPDFAFVLVLIDIQGLTYAEAAETVGVPVNTVRTRLFRARTLLRRRILSGRGTSPRPQSYSNRGS